MKEPDGVEDLGCLCFQISSEEASAFWWAGCGQQCGPGTKACSPGDCLRKCQAGMQPLFLAGLLVNEYTLFVVSLHGFLLRPTCEH